MDKITKVISDLQQSIDKLMFLFPTDKAEAVIKALDLIQSEVELIELENTPSSEINIRSLYQSINIYKESDQFTEDVLKQLIEANTYE